MPSSTSTTSGAIPGLRKEFLLVLNQTTRRCGSSPHPHRQVEKDSPNKIARKFCQTSPEGGVQAFGTTTLQCERCMKNRKLFSNKKNETIFSFKNEILLKHLCNNYVLLRSFIVFECFVQQPVSMLLDAWMFYMCVIYFLYGNNAFLAFLILYHNVVVSCYVGSLELLKVYHKVVLLIKSFVLS